MKFLVVVLLALITFTGGVVASGPLLDAGEYIESATWNESGPTPLIGLEDDGNVGVVKLGGDLDEQRALYTQGPLSFGSTYDYNERQTGATVNFDNDEAMLVAAPADSSFTVKNSPLIGLMSSYFSSPDSLLQEWYIQAVSESPSERHLYIGPYSSTGALGDAALAIDQDGHIRLPNLPTSDPLKAGALWNDSGTLKVSAGE